MAGNMSSHLFAYGTLMRDAGHPMHKVLSRGAQYLGEAWFTGRLYRVHHYPGVVASNNPDDKVFGELYALSSLRETLGELDDYEGCGVGASKPTEFVRSLAHVHRSDGASVEAWIYLYNRPVGGAPRILSGRYNPA